jgi:pyridoxamine 5'-phosphate oxidase
MAHDLDERTVPRNPIDLFREWYANALDAKELRPDAMTLATASPDGRPSARIMLYKGVDRDGFIFYTNYSSRKGEQISANPLAALVFFWGGLNRQVRVEGSLHRLSPEESDAYFSSRPRESQIGAVTSPQSKVIPDRESFDRSFEENERRFSGKAIPRPAHWGGFRLVPSRIEFWQGREARLHDRIEYLLEQNEWRIRRLAP